MCLCVLIMYVCLCVLLVYVCLCVLLVYVCLCVLLVYVCLCVQLMYGQLEAADAMIEDLCRDKVRCSIWSLMKQGTL